MKIFLLFLLLGLTTFLMRFLFIGIVEKHQLPEKVKLALTFVPLAVFTAIIAPEVVAHTGTISISLTEPRIYAALAAIIVAALSKRVLPTLVVGMAVLWLCRYLM